VPFLFAQQQIQINLPSFFRPHTACDGHAFFATVSLGKLKKTSFFIPFK